MLDDESREVRAHGLFYGGAFHDPIDGRYLDAINPSTGERLARIADAASADVNAAVAAAHKGFAEWRLVPPLERAKVLREIAARYRMNDRELARIDAMDGGNPMREMIPDVHHAASWHDFHAGLVTEMKGDTIPYGTNAVNFTQREPLGVVARVTAFNHPFMFVAGKFAAPLAAGNAVIMKPSEHASLSALRMAELVGDLVPPGTLNVITGGRKAGEALAVHKKIAMITLVGSVPTGKAIMRAASDTLKPLLFELGGKNALIARPDAQVEEIARAAVAGMNFGWCGQSCGSTSRLFVHESLHDAVVARIVEIVRDYRPGDPTEDATTMGAINNKAQYEKVLGYIDIARSEGANVACGGKRPEDPALKNGFFVEPTVLTGVDQSMRIANEEVFGPVLSVLKWQDEAAMIEQVNAVDYGLTCSIWTRDLDAAHRLSGAVEAGYVWINKVGAHFLGAPFGGYKQSGIGRENCLQELLAFTREKNVHIAFRAS